MKSTEYIILEKMLEKNRRLFRKKIIEPDEYIENHELIMKRIKNIIFKIEKSDMNILQLMDVDDSINRFRNEIFIVKYNLN